MKTHWFPLIRPAIKPLISGGAPARIPKKNTYDETTPTPHLRLACMPDGYSPSIRVVSIEAVEVGEWVCYVHRCRIRCASFVLWLVETTCCVFFFVCVFFCLVVFTSRPILTGLQRCDFHSFLENLIFLSE